MHRHIPCLFWCLFGAAMEMCWQIQRPASLRLVFHQKGPLKINTCIGFLHPHPKSYSFSSVCFLLSFPFLDTHFLYVFLASSMLFGFYFSLLGKWTAQCSTLFFLSEIAFLIRRSLVGTEIWLNVVFFTRFNSGPCWRFISGPRLEKCRNVSFYSFGL